MRALVIGEMRQHFRPEFLNRVDEVGRLPPADHGGPGANRGNSIGTPQDKIGGAADVSGTLSGGGGRSGRAGL